MFGAYLATVIITAAVSVAATAAIVYQVVKLVMRQIKLYHSITLVELRTNKIAYWIFAGVIGFLMFYLIMQMADGESPGVVAFAALFGVDMLHADIAFAFALLVMTASEALVIGLALSRNAIVDKGVYTNFAVLDWHQVRDYMIDEDKGIVVLSSDKDTFSTLRRLTSPFKVKKQDVEKIKFILNKNKNKFSDYGAD